MWIEKTKNGFRLVERVKIAGKYKRVSVPTPSDTPKARKAAQIALQDKIAHISLITGESTEISLSKAFEEYLRLTDRRESSEVVIRSVLRGLLSVLGDGDISAYNAHRVRQLFARANIKPTVQNRYIRRFKTVTRWLYDMGYTETDIGDKLRLVKVKEPTKEVTELYLEEDRIKEILENLNGMPYYATRFLLLTGCRVGEMTALTPADIGERYITIDKSYSSTVYKVTPPKTAASIRQIYIQPELRELLDEFLKWRKINMLAYGLRPETLFYNLHGGYYVRGNLCYHLQKLGTHPHIFRHTHISMLAEKGLTLEEIARRIGHDDTDITRKIYYHITEKQKKKDEEKLSAIRLLS